MFLDRGDQLDWFSSLEIIIEAVVAASALYIFLVHTFTAKKPFVEPKLFLDPQLRDRHARSSSSSASPIWRRWR